MIDQSIDALDLISCPQRDGNDRHNRIDVHKTEQQDQDLMSGSFQERAHHVSLNERREDDLQGGMEDEKRDQHQTQQQDANKGAVINAVR